jgi:uncharacterized protein (TIGR03437 family)
MWASAVLVSALAPAGWSQALMRLDFVNLRAPAVNENGLTIFFAARIRPDAQIDTATNLHRWTRLPSAAVIERLTNYVSDSPFAGVTTIAYPGTGEILVYTALPDGVAGREEVRVINLTNRTDRLLAADTEGCVQPLCVNCFRACLRSVHLTPDGRTALYEAARNQPFYTVQTDQSGSRRLPVYQGALAPSPQRVIADGGIVVFTSSAPNGPTVAPAPGDVYLMNLDGSGLRNVTNFTDPAVQAFDAVISKDGTRIVFAVNLLQPGVRSSEPQIWTVRSNGTDLRRLSTGVEAASSPSISADGSTAAYVQGGRVMRVGVNLDPAPVSLTDLVTSVAASPVVSDNGAQVAFALGSTFGTPAAVYRAASAETNRNLRQLTPIYTPRVLFPGGVVSAAGAMPASSGSLITVYGANLGFDDLAVAPGFPLPLELKEVSLLVNDQPIPIHSTTPWQINAHLPQSVGPSSPAFKVRYDDGVVVPPVNGEVRAAAPENFFIRTTQGGQAVFQAAAFHAGTLNLADAARPARPGEILEVYGLGFGATNPPVPAGVASPVPPAVATSTPRLSIGGRPASLTFAGLLPGYAGVYQANVVVPSGLPAGFHTLAWTQPDGSTVSFSGIFVQ